jgi:hypothetical protein
MRVIICLITTLLSSAAVAAEAQSVLPAAPETPPSQAEPRAPLSPEEMESASGGQGVALQVTTQQQLTGTTSGNTVTAGVLNSGDVSFGAEALDGFSGIGNFVINTGANNTLQGAINISIATTPGL